jgi:sec-independent protein translocase protein TatA
MGSLGTTELVIVFGIVILIFGPGRIFRIAKEAGQAINAFKSGLGEEKEATND